jgi:polyisoprenoid-binding protein YceI
VTKSRIVLVSLAAPLLVLVGLTATTLGRAPRTFVIDPAESRAIISVGKVGVFAFAAGHTHEVEGRPLRGTLELDAADLPKSSVHLELDTKLLRVTGKDEPAKDVPEVQRTMLSDKVLDVERYRTIVFQSTRVTASKTTGKAVELSVSGNLTLHGTTKPMTIPVTAEVGEQQVSAHGKFPIKQTDFGMSPISVAGVVKVNNELEISFTVVARPR